MDNERRITEATLEVADNGYVLRIDQDEMVLVYEDTKLPDDIGGELLSDLDDLIDKEEYSAFRIRVEVIPIPDVPFEKK